MKGLTRGGILCLSSIRGVCRERANLGREMRVKVYSLPESE